MEHVSIIAQFSKKNPSHNYGTIKIRGYFKRKAVATKSTGHKILEIHWDANTRQVNSKAPNATLINTAISIKIQEMNAALLKKEIMGATVSRHQVVKAIKGADHSRDFLSFCRERIQIEYPNKETRRSYLGECTKLEEFRPALSFGDINYDFLARYKQYMTEELHNDTNTIWKSFKFINTMIRKAIKMGDIIQENPFSTFNRGKYTQKPKIGLEIHECDRIEQISRDENQPVILRRVALYMLLMSYSGMRFNDAMKFNPDIHFQSGRLIMDYQKFSGNVNYKVFDRLANVIERVKTNRLKLSNKEFNKWLKVLGPLAGTKLSLTSHMGRHTLGGLLADMEIPEEQAQKILGHKDIRSTRVYYHVKNKAVDKSLQKLNNL